MNKEVILITGSSKGIGRGISEYFALKNFLVEGCSRGPANIDSENYNHTIVDVSDEKQVRKWVREVNKKYRKIDVLICNAGIVKSSPMVPMFSKSAFDDYINTQLVGTFLTCREVSKIMCRQKKGRIINISSAAVRLNLVGTSAYTSTKGAIDKFTKVLANELAQYNITCNLVAPGLVLTEATKEFDDEWKNNLLNKLTIKKVTTPDDVANVISFFIKPESSCITGQTIYMNLIN